MCCRSAASREVGSQVQNWFMGRHVCRHSSRLCCSKQTTVSCSLTFWHGFFRTRLANEGFVAISMVKASMAWILVRTVLRMALVAIVFVAPISLLFPSDRDACAPAAPQEIHLQLHLHHTSSSPAGGSSSRCSTRLLFKHILQCQT